MSEIRTGGPVFPISGEACRDFDTHEGIHLRDYLAAKAMQALMTGDTLQKLDKVLQDEDKVFALVAKSAYAMADAMLAERQKAYAKAEGLS